MEGGRNVALFSYFTGWLMTYYANFAVGDTRARKGKNRITSEPFYDLSLRLLGQYQAFSMWLSYGEAFAEYFEQEIKDEKTGKFLKYAWSAKGWGGDVPAYFTDFPVDFDAEGDLDKAFKDCKAFVETELLGRGIDTRYFVIYLSGGKGFHIHISASVLNVALPIEHAGFRMKQLATEWKKTYSTLDLTVYSSTSLFRTPGSKHKSGLHKVEVAWEDFTLDHMASRGIWAAEAPETVRIPELTDPPVKIDLPEYTPAVASYSYNTEVDFDPNAAIVPNCRWLQGVLRDPSNNGNDGTGREKRRNAIGILLSAHETSEHNPELQSFVNGLAQSEYMSFDKMEDVSKWIREYDNDGEIKCKKTCYSVGCPAAQRKKCGTKSPLDWKLKKKILNLTPIDVARATIREEIEGILDEEGNGITVVDFPVGSGKTYSLIRVLRERDLTAFYVAQTHRLAIQTHNDFLAQGLESRHCASRSYLKEENAFDCLYPDEVEMAMANGYGSHTVCSLCPRKRKSQPDQKGMHPDDGYEPCDYWEQFEGLKDVDVVVGVHNHLFEYMYEAADVSSRSITIIDESPVEVLGQTIHPIDPQRLDRIRGAFVSEIATLEAMVGSPSGPVVPRAGIFGRVAAILDMDEAKLELANSSETLQTLLNFQNVFQGNLFDFERYAGMPHEQLRAIWFGVANRLAEASGLADEYNLPEERRFLCIPFPLPSAIALAARNIVYNPEKTNYLPVQLPPNKIIILDATASNDAYAEIIAQLTRGQEARSFRFVSHPLIEQPYSHVTQITSSSYGVSALFHEETRLYIFSVIAALMKKHVGKSLIVCHKQHRSFWLEQFGRNPLVQIATYGSLKGLNQWSDCVAQYIVGTPFIPDSGVRDLAAKLGNEVDTYVLEQDAVIKRVMMLAKNGDTAVVSRRIYKSHPFHTALAQMKSQWEVTQAVRLRLYNKSIEEKQQLYVFSNVDLKGMYADEYHTLSELAFEISKGEVSAGRKELEIKGVAYEQITAWFDTLPKGEVFVKNNIPDFSGDRYIQYWIQMALDAEWITRQGSQRKYTKVVD